MEKEISANKILEKLKWYHGDKFTTDLLKDDFLEMLKKENEEQQK